MTLLLFLAFFWNIFKEEAMDDNTILLRQVHPKFFPNHKLSSQAFFPFPKDEGLLSVYDGDLISAKDAYDHFTQSLHCQSAGVWGVSCAEVKFEKLTSRPDPLKDFPEHAVISFDSEEKKCLRKIAKLLKAHAEKRGCLFCAP